MARVIEITLDQFKTLRELGAPVGFLGSYDREYVYEDLITENWEYVAADSALVHFDEDLRYYTLVDSDD